MDRYTHAVINGIEKLIPKGQSVASMMIEAAENTEPELFAKLYPRIYSETGAYYSPKLIAAFLTDAIACSRDLPIDNITQAHRMMLPGMRYMIDKHMPYMFIAPQLLEAIKRTDFPSIIDWKELKLPYEHGIFLLPKGALVHPTDGDASCILYSRLVHGTYPSPDRGIMSFDALFNSFSFLALCHENALWYDGNLTDKGGLPTIVKLNDLFVSTGDDFAAGPNLPCPTDLDHPLNEVDSIFLEQVAVVLFGTFLAMNARPQLNTPAQLERVIQKKGQQRKEFWSPNIIGKDYKLAVPKVITGGTHASPKMHWRRGHFREQAIGAGRVLRKTIWLEPMLVGATTKGKT